MILFLQDFSCGVCARTYYTKSGLQAHRRQIHAREGPGFSCAECTAEGREQAELFPTR